jgi:hydroxyethylthiazole kinase-like uncharacterized protein yjeF
VIPIVTPAEMAAIDRAAPEAVDVLVARAGAAVAWTARELLGGVYGRRVVVLAGKGNNGNDGRDAARRLRRWGVRTSVVEVADAPAVLPAADLVIDAAFGTGFRGEYRAPDVRGTPVLAVDIPSGVDGLTGAVAERVLPAVRTVTFAALKPGLVLFPGAAYTGDLDVVDIGLDVSVATIGLVEGSDVGAWLPSRPPSSHKWRQAVWVAAGSPGMTGAAALVAGAALRAGAGYVRLGVPGGVPGWEPVEAVGVTLPEHGWDADVLADLARFGALAVGPGLGRTDATRDAVRGVVAGAPVPVVVDGDGLSALGDAAAAVLGERAAPTVLTPHDGEFERLAGAPPGPDRIAAARALASDFGVVVLLKGPLTVVAEPGGRALLAGAGDARLATAGTGDVLTGVVAAFLAAGLPAAEAAAAAAYVHGAAGNLGFARGLVAGDLVALLPAVLSQLPEV